MDKKRIDYDRMWKNSDVQNPAIWPMWEVAKNFNSGKNLEIGPGNRPRIPISGAYFLDISSNAIKNLKNAGGIAVVGDITNIPFEDNFFDTVTVIETLEHIENDERAFSEIARVVKPSGLFFFSVPLGMRFYNEVDVIAGHKRRYEIEDLRKLLARNNFRILKFRGPSAFVRILYKLGDLFAGKIASHDSTKKNTLESFNLPKAVINLSARGIALLQKIGTAQWETTPEGFGAYKERWIVILCQKKAKQKRVDGAHKE